MKKLSLLISATLLCSSAFAQIDLNKGLMLHLPFNGNTMDASPNANNATNFGAMLTTDQWGNANSAYEFDGVSTYMAIADNPSLTNESFTLCAKVFPKGYYSDAYYSNFIVGKGNYYWIPGQYVMQFDAWYYPLPPSSALATAGPSFSDTTPQVMSGYCYNAYPKAGILNYTPKARTGQWYCLVLIADADSIHFYQNGNLKFSYLRSGMMGKNTADLRIGKHGDPSYPYATKGKIDDIRLYNRALNMLEIDSVCSNVNPQQQGGGSSIKTNREVESLQLANNPVGNELQLNLAAKQMGGELSIIDMTGKTVLKISALQTSKIKLDGIASGMYIVNYLLDNSYLRAKMVKQ